VYVEKTTGKDASFFEGKDGKINYNQKNAAGNYTGKFGYERDGYTFVFDYVFETEKWLNITLTAEASGVKLYIDGRLKGQGARTEFGTYTTKNLSTSMILPTEKIGNGIVGKLDNLIIKNTITELGPKNIAPTASNATTSNDYSTSYTGMKAIDRDLSTRWATANEINGATLELTFAQPVSVDETRIVEYGSGTNYINKYNIEYWDGAQWKIAVTHDNITKQTTSGVTNGREFSKSFPKATSSRIRLNIIDAMRPSIYEFELYCRNCNPSGLATVPTDNEIVSYEYYSLLGTKLNRKPDFGLFIECGIKTDGSKISEKKLIK